MLDVLVGGAEDYLSKIAAAAPSSNVALGSRLLQLSADVVVANEISGEFAALL